MLKIIDSFVHTSPDIHGKGCLSEFLIPDILDFENKFIGLQSGTKYDIGLVVGTHQTWDENTLLEKARAIRTFGTLGKEKRLSILRNYITQIEVSKNNQPDSI